MTTFTPLKLDLQQTITVGTELDWHDISQQNQALISADEFVSSSSSYPLFFTKSSLNGRFSAIALLGLQDDNIFFNGQLSNDVAYLPKSLSMLPFGLGADPENEQQLTTSINLQSQLIGQSGGASLLNDDGSSSERLTQINQEFSAIFEAHVNTEHFIAALLEHHLLMELVLNVNCDNGENKVIKGLYNINEQQLSQLTAEQKLLFIERGYYPPIMAMLASLVQVNRMIKLYSQKKVMVINSVNMKVV
tara:strand:+ start:20014 stop:20757 length:744 start_codon:yes stop_codon:yes gene_type:complete